MLVFSPKQEKEEDEEDDIVENELLNTSIGKKTKLQNKFQSIAASLAKLEDAGGYDKEIDEFIQS